jgi:signal transduction histidine kinase
MGGILLIFAGVVYVREVDSQLQAFDQSLYKKSKVIANQTQYQLKQGQWRIELDGIPSLQQDKTLSLNAEVAYVRWYNAQGQLIQFWGASAPGQLTVPPGVQTIQIDPNHLKALSSERWLREVTLPVMQENILIGYLQIAMPLVVLRENLEQTRLFLALGIPVTLGAIGLTGWILGGLAMKPIHQSYQQLQRFTADASHELRAPLAAILSNAQVGLLAPPDDDSQHRQRLENIVDLTKSMSTLVGNLLFLSRQEGPLVNTALSDVDLMELLQPLVEDFTAQAEPKKLSFTSDFPEQPINLRAEPNLLRQAVMNLLTNAFKYTPEGGTVQLQVLPQSHRVAIQVKDNGIGIPSADLPHIFGRFYRVDTARSRQTGGFGLGLAIAQQIVQAHGGQITAQSLVGQGSTFQIELPLKPTIRA